MEIWPRRWGAADPVPAIAKNRGRAGAADLSICDDAARDGAAAGTAPANPGRGAAGLEGKQRGVGPGGKDPCRGICLPT